MCLNGFEEEIPEASRVICKFNFPEQMFSGIVKKC